MPSMKKRRAAELRSCGLRVRSMDGGLSSFGRTYRMRREKHQVMAEDASPYDCNELFAGWSAWMLE